MKPEARSQELLSITQSKAKMYEYGVPEEYHIALSRDPGRLFTLAIGLLGDLASEICSDSPKLERVQTLRENLAFSARFFDAYLQSHLRPDIDLYTLILASAAYYLCDLPGSSRVLIEQLGTEYPDLECLGLEKLLCWALRGDYKDAAGEEAIAGQYADVIKELRQWLRIYYETGEGETRIWQLSSDLRRTAYASGTARQLLIADVCGAVIRRKIENSTWYSLPKYTGLSAEQWSETLRKDTFIRELWPAQHLLGKKGAFRGKSAIVQMPTSAGKTKALEVIIRSAFLSERTRLAVIVAPFRALCHEIKEDLKSAFRQEPIYIDELSDVLQIDFDIALLLVGRQVLIVTPEKLNFVLYHAPDLGSKIGLLIYDEGHQFDNGSRGITYELLVTSLKGMVPEGAQTILISAVIQNASAIGGWLKEGSEIISGANLLPTYKRIAFTSWKDTLGRIWFVDPADIEKDEFYVPRVISQAQLALHDGERVRRSFPSDSNGSDVALYLGLKLVRNGSVAIFCGTKAIASSLCERAVDIFDRDLKVPAPTAFSDGLEVARLVHLHELHFGPNSAMTQSAKLGIFAHHNNVPHGIRLAVEHAIKGGLARFVICTSTLAQGVNLPIRYLLVTSAYQGYEPIKVRDFQNLIGRSGRSGMHTEGSIIFADPQVYDNRKGVGNSQWKKAKELLGAEHSEPVVSTLLSIFEPLESDNRRAQITLEPFALVDAYIKGDRELDTLLGGVADQHSALDFSIEGLRKQVAAKVNILVAVENYLLSHWSEIEGGRAEVGIVNLAKATLAYYLGDQDQREQIEHLFRLLASSIADRVPSQAKKLVYGRTLLGVRTSMAIDAWLAQNYGSLALSRSDEELLLAVWPIIAGNVTNSAFTKCDKPGLLSDLCLAWMRGSPFVELHEMLTKGDARMVTGKQRRNYKIEHVVDICENAISYQGTLGLGALLELTAASGLENSPALVSSLESFQKRLKYGLPSSLSIALYELGFADRFVAVGLSQILGNVSSKRTIVIEVLKEKQDLVLKFLAEFPSYFSRVNRNLV